MSSEISKQEYLKRYLEKEKDSDRKRKKKPKKKAQIPSLKIINEDIDLKSINFGEEKELDEADEAPVVAEIIDERPLEVKMKEQYHSSRWKKIDDEDSLSNSIKENESKKPNLGSSFLVEKSFSEKNYAESDKSNLKRSRHDSDSDISPPRHLEKVKRKENNSYTQSSKRNRNDSGSDISPPRSKEQSKSRHDSDSDISPPRHNLNKSYNRQKSNRYNSDSDLSPPRSKLSKTTASSRQTSKRHDSDSDLSPPRHKLSKSAIESPQKSKHHGSDSDLSPPRHRNSESLQKNRRSKRTNSDSDISPPRHRVSHKSNSLTKSSSGKHDSDSDRLSSKNYDHLPPRLKPDGECKEKRDKSGYRSVSPSLESLAKDKSKKLDKTLSGLKAGLQNSKTLQMEVQDLRERERNQLNTLGDEISGRNAGTIVRDRKTGLKRDFNQEQEKKKEEDMKTKEYQKKYAVWGKGIEQQVDKVEQFKDDIYEMSKPLARYRDDEDLDERLKSIIREDDPMAEYIKKKKQKDTPSFPVYKGPLAPPNRFGIQPGYRWDGVDRSNGFEKKYFEKINKSKAIETEAYLWSVQDM